MSFFSEQLQFDSNHSHSILHNERGYQLWLGDYAAAENVEQLNQRNIRTVISATSGGAPVYDKSISHHHFVIRDTKNSNIFVHFDRVCDWIHTGLQHGSVLVHCGAGASRSATLVIAYLMRHQRLSFQQALNFCKKKRSQTCPNLGFQRQLKLYEKSLGIKREGSQHTHNYSSREDELPPLRQTPKRLMMPQRKPQRSSQELRKPSVSKVRRQDTPIDLLSKYLKRMAEFRFGVDFNLQSSIKSSVRFRK